MNMDHSAWEGYEIAGRVDTVISRGEVLVAGRRACTAARDAGSSCVAACPVPGVMRMDFGVVFQLDPPASDVIRLAQRAEAAGFSHVWTFDSHLLWQEPFVIYSQILANTSSVVVGPMVTNPGTRDSTVTASLFATLNEHVRQPDDLRHRPRRLGPAYARRPHRRRSPSCASASRSSGRSPTGDRSTLSGAELHFPWVTDGQLEVWVAAYGPKALAVAGEVGDGYILQLADPDIAAWMIDAVRTAAERAGRDPAAIKFCVAAPAYVGDDLAHQRDQTRWFGGMVGNHVADIVAALRRQRRRRAAGADRLHRRTPRLRLRRARPGRQPTRGLRPGRDRRPVLRARTGRRTTSARLRELRELGVDQFAIYLQHDDKDGDARRVRQRGPARTVLTPRRDRHQHRPAARPAEFVLPPSTFADGNILTTIFTEVNIARERSLPHSCSETEGAHSR